MGITAAAEKVILVVDDDEDIRDAVQELLADEGYRTHSAENGLEALEWLRGHRDESCLVLLDLMMPVMDGETFLRHKERDPALAQTPIVVITAGATCRQVLASHDVRDCIAKPLSAGRLLSAVASYS